MSSTTGVLENNSDNLVHPYRVQIQRKRNQRRQAEIQLHRRKPRQRHRKQDQGSLTIQTRPTSMALRPY